MYCYHSIRGREKTKRREKEQQSGVLLHQHTQAYNNTTQGPNNTENEYNKTKHKTKAQRIDIEKRSEADRVEHQINKTTV